MLTDAALKHLRPKEKSYKVTDRDGMYALVSTKGSISFRLDYRMNGRRETVTFGKYGPADLSLARARELCIDARRAIKEGRSPAIEKQRAKRRLMEAKGFGELCTEQTHQWVRRNASLGRSTSVLANPGHKSPVESQPGADSFPVAIPWS